LNRGQSSYRLTAAVRGGLGQGVFGVSAGFSAGFSVVAGAAVFAAGFLVSLHPMTATTATSSVAANNCFMIRSPQEREKLSPTVGMIHLNITIS
jgi:hypothetical protein